MPECMQKRMGLAAPLHARGDSPTLPLLVKALEGAMETEQIAVASIIGPLEKNLSALIESALAWAKGGGKGPALHAELGDGASWENVAVVAKKLLLTVKNPDNCTEARKDISEHRDRLDSFY